MKRHNLNSVVRQAGFTFVEIIIALGLAAILLPALGQALSFSIRVATQGEKFSQAYNLAQQGMEQIYAQKSQNWSALANSTYTIGQYTRDITIESILRCGVPPAWDICPDGNPDDGNTKKITVVVSWPETGGMQTASLSGYVTHY